MHINFTMDRPADRILVVDTALEQRRLITEYFIDAGMICSAVGSSDGALSALRTGHVDFVIVGDRIEGMSTVDFIRKVAGLSPSTFVIYCSDQDRAAKELLGQKIRFKQLPWPVVLADLAEVIRKESLNTEAG
jgi:DNA-binding response OmpR family regulator